MTRARLVAGIVVRGLSLAGCTVGLGGVSLVACAPPPTAPAQPTWADVEPIVMGECSQCHGATASRTGSGYRLDFYDMTAETCGDAAAALSGGILASGAAPTIAADVAVQPDGRARMPPAPAQTLHGWQRDTLTRWAAQPVKGPPPSDNQPPTLQIGAIVSAGGHLKFTVLLSDPDGDPTVGIINMAGARFAMDRPGTFAVDFNMALLPAGSQRMTAVVCDGWINKTFDLGPWEIKR